MAAKAPRQPRTVAADGRDPCRERSIASARGGDVRTVIRSARKPCRPSLPDSTAWSRLRGRTDRSANYVGALRLAVDGWQERETSAWSLSDSACTVLARTASPATAWT